MGVNGTPKFLGNTPAGLKQVGMKHGCHSHQFIFT